MNASRKALLSALIDRPVPTAGTEPSERPLSVRAAALATYLLALAGLAAWLSLD